MIRQLMCGVLLLVLIAAVLDSTGRAQPPQQDTIYYRDRKDKDAAPKSVDGELKPAPAGYQIISGGKVVTTVSPADIIRVVPGDLPGVDRKDVLALVANETKKEWEKARTGYADLLKKTANPQEKTRRYLEFKIATMTARAADEAADDSGWKERTEEATKMLEVFLVAYTGGWEIWPAARTCARLQMEQGKYQDAARTWAKTGQVKDMPADLVQDAGLQEIDLLIRGKQYAVAGARVDALAKTAPAGSFKDKLTIYAAAVKAAGGVTPTDGIPAIDAEIAKTKDPGVRAVGFMMKGELYLLADKPREAMWEFLWVEVVYNQDRDDVVKAMLRVIDTLRLQNDDERVKNYREKLRRYRSTL
jgi:hypothetical protein